MLDEIMITPVNVARQLVDVQRRMRERVWAAANVRLAAVTLDTDTTVHTLRAGHQPDATFAFALAREHLLIADSPTALRQVLDQRLQGDPDQDEAAGDLDPVCLLGDHADLCGGDTRHERAGA